MSGPVMDGVRVVMGRPRAGHARPLQSGNFCSGRRPQRPAEGSRPLVLVEKQVPFGLLGGRGRTCPARLWMVYGWLWEGRGPGMPGPYRAAIFAAGGTLNARRRGQDPSLQYLWKSRCLLGYWAVGLWSFAAAAHLHHSAGASVASGTGVSSGCGAFASRYA